MTAAPAASPLARLTAALDDGADLVGQVVAVLRAWSVPLDGALDPADAPVGVADRALLAVVEEVTGRPLEHTVACASCGSSSTLVLGRAEIGEHAPRCAVVACGVGVREPTYADLLAAGDDPGALLLLCTVGDPTVARPTLDHLARVEGSLSGPLHSVCVSCGAAIEADVDVTVLALAALAAEGAEVDREVHLLASAYGWDLATIEALPDARRQRLAALVSGVA